MINWIKKKHDWIQIKYNCRKFTDYVMNNMIDFILLLGLAL